MLSCSVMRGSIRSLFESSTLHCLRKYCHGRKPRATLFKCFELPPPTKTVLDMKPKILTALALENSKFFRRLSCVNPAKPSLTSSLLEQTDITQEQLNLKHQTLEEWKQTCLRQSIFDAIVGIFKLIGSFLMAVIRALVNLVKMLMSSETRQKAAQFKQQASEKMSPHFQKGKDTMEREIPRLKSKLEEGIPAAKKNIDNFNSRVQDELRDAKTYGEKQDRFFNVLGDYVKSSKALQIFLIIIFVYFLWNFLKALFRVVFPKRGKASCELEQVA